MDLAVDEALAVGNGILTVENDDAGLGAGARRRAEQGRRRGRGGARHDRAPRALRAGR